MAKKEENVVYNFDIVKYFRTGNKERMTSHKYGVEGEIVDDKVLYFPHSDENPTPAAIKTRDGRILFNGDDNSDGDLVDDFEGEITTSLTCLQNAGIKDLSRIEILDEMEDERAETYAGQEDFDSFNKTMPRGALYWEGKDTKGNVSMKSYHKAGGILIKAGNGTLYICGMDEDSYFVSQLKGKKATTIPEAFQALKPKRVIAYEEKSGEQAKRQGEWYFIPCPDMVAINMKPKALPVNHKDSNKHKVSEYEKSKDGRHYCKGGVTHPDHEMVELGDNLHEAVENTAVGSWSQEGVD